METRSRGLIGIDAGYDSPMSSDKNAGDGISDEEMVAQVNRQTDSELQQKDFFERESDGTTTDTEAAEADADEAAAD